MGDIRDKNAAKIKKNIKNITKAKSKTKRNFTPESAFPPKNETKYIKTKEETSIASIFNKK